MKDPSESLRRFIRPVRDFPRKGILFRDITPLLLDEAAFGDAIEVFYRRYLGMGIDKIVSIEARGFILGSVLAYRLGIGFVPVRKPNKLPAETIREAYTLEYGEDTLEMHADAIGKGDSVLIIDDLLATGGSAVAASRLVERCGGVIRELAFLIELSFLNGREKLRPRPVFTIIDYRDEVS
ncbi:MAG TPA: adenine phosphoribosyltransferase [Bacteroidota bacterium]|nr:adenine phosphoribosyltransferase [Bacteroidota bacterium]